MNYLKPTPINQPLRFEAAVDSVAGKKFSVKGRCHIGDLCVSEAEALVLGSIKIPMADHAA